MIPAGVTSRTTLLPKSPMNTSPEASTATPLGLLSVADVAAPPSPE